MPIKIVRKVGSARESALRARHRRSVLAALIEICAGLERMQATESGRAACREVAAMLRQALGGRSRAGEAAKSAGEGGR